MTVRQAVLACLRLLSARDRRRLALVTIAQMSTAILDLVGVLLIGVVTALSVSVMTNSTPPAFIGTVAEWEGFGGRTLVELTVTLAVLAAILLVTKSLISILLSRGTLRFLANRQALVAGNLAAGLLSRPLLQVQQRSSQETAYALTTGVNFATLIVLGQTVIASSELTLLLALGAGLLIISPLVTLFTVGFFALIAFVLQRVLSGWAGREGSRAARTDVDSLASVQEALGTYREAVVSHRRSHYVERFQVLRWEAAMAQSDMLFINALPKYIFEIALIVGAGLLAFSQLVTKDVTSAVATIAVFLAAGSRIVPSMLRLQSAAIMIRVASSQAAPTLELADELDASGAGSTSLQEASDPAMIRRRLEAGHGDFVGEIVLEDVWLTYPGASATALDGVSLTVRAGTSLALVGTTGAGKSTLADVILGVLAADKGTVLIDGEPPIEAIARWPGALAYVPQDVALSNGTVRENVCLGLPAAAIDDAWVWNALERAHLADFLKDRRDGLDTVVGEGGLKFSGGQRQRLGVARALYSRPRLLVLDEATSALDAETEQAIAATLHNLEGEVTTVTIAHRLATIRDCNVVVFLEEGRIVAQGTFDEVRAQSPHFDQQAQLLGL